MPKNPRRPTPTAVELSVLDRSRRRCALCFHFNGDLTEKAGQIAHLDDDPSNSTEDNLAFLCLEHHSFYDSKTKQHKNYTMAEAKKARNDLYDAIEASKHIVKGTLTPAGIEVGEDSVAYGNLPPGTKVGSRSVIVGPTDGHNVYIPGGTAAGYGAYADPTSVSLGAGAGARGRMIGKTPRV